MKEYIVITPSNLKKKVIELSRKKYYNYNIKFMSINEFIDKYTFSYDNKTIYNIMNKYNGRAFEVRNYDNLGEEDKSKKTTECNRYFLIDKDIIRKQQKTYREESLLTRLQLPEF